MRPAPAPATWNDGLTSAEEAEAGEEAALKAPDDPPPPACARVLTVADEWKTLFKKKARLKHLFLGF